VSQTTKYAEQESRNEGQKKKTAEYAEYAEK